MLPYIPLIIDHNLHVVSNSQHSVVSSLPLWTSLECTITHNYILGRLEEEEKNMKSMSSLHLKKSEAVYLSYLAIDQAD